jgi:hypothetical protein
LYVQASALRRVHALVLINRQSTHRAVLAYGAVSTFRIAGESRTNREQVHMDE